MDLINKIKDIYNSEPSYYSQKTRDDEIYQNFLSQFPLKELNQITIDDYCIGEGSSPQSFSWWIEVGLRPVIGTYGAGSARSHLIYKKKDGTLYKNRNLQELDDKSALKYIMSITKLIAEAKDLEEAQLYDDDGAIYEGASIESLVTMGPARKLRVFNAYNPLKTLSINSPNHIEHFLRHFGYDSENIKSGVFAKAYQLWQVYENAKADIGNISPNGFTTILYSEELGIAPANKSNADAAEEDTVLDPLDLPKNVILYGPPGTGKTFSTINKSLEILDPQYYLANKSNRHNLLSRFNEFKDQGRIGFVTFHQSFSYEEFVEGLKPEADENGNVNYYIDDGIFKKMCNAVSSQITKQSEKQINLEGKNIWKMSLGDTQSDESYIYQDCINNNYILLGYGDDIDFSHCKTREDIKEKFASKLTEKNSDYPITAVYNFIHTMKVGDIVVVSDGNHKFRAIGQITGEYKYYQRDEISYYSQCRSVEWLRVYSPSRPKEELIEKTFSQMTLYKIGSDNINMKKLQTLLKEEAASNSKFEVGKTFGSTGQKYTVSKNTDEVLELTKPNGSKLPFTWDTLNELLRLVKLKHVSIDDIQKKSVFDKVPESTLEKYIINGYNNILAPIVSELVTLSPKNDLEERNKTRVLIIDEINRGNVAKIFGELITLIEENKRSGKPEAISVTLPYSKTEFSVPKDLYLIGTMNTADRSLTSIDAALRRRFKFEEIAPDPSLLSNIKIEDINLVKMLQTINYRIELFLGREYLIGHSYFLQLRDDPSLGTLEEIFSREIIPLLKEYFFDDWEKIHRVLGDHQKHSNLQMIKRRFDADTTAALIGDDWNDRIDCVWQINENALSDPESYKEIYKDKNHSLHAIKTA